MLKARDDSASRMTIKHNNDGSVLAPRMTIGHNNDGSRGSHRDIRSEHGLWSTASSSLCSLSSDDYWYQGSKDEQ